MKKSILIAIIVILILLVAWGALSLFSSPAQESGANKTFGGIFSSLFSGSKQPPAEEPPGSLYPSGGEEASSGAGDGTWIEGQTPGSFLDSIFGFFRGDDSGFSNITGGSLGGGTGQIGTTTPIVFPFTELTDVPVAGAIAFSSGTGTSSPTIVRYMERSTGHVYDLNISTNKKTRVTNTTIPRVHDALFSYSGAYVVARFLDDDDQTVETFLGKIPASGSNGSLVGEFLPRNITAFSLSPDTDEIFYLLKTGEGVAGFIAPLKTPAQRKQVLSFPFSEWLTQWISKQYIGLFTKPSGLVPGYAYYVDLLIAKATGEPAKVDAKITGGVAGLTVLVNGVPSAALYANNTPSLAVYDVKSREHKPTILRTMPEKCVWAKDGVVVYCAVPEFVPAGIYPDDWYQGAISFKDGFIRGNTDSGNLEYLGGSWNLPASVLDVDATNLFLSPMENDLFFINKKNMRLWRANLLTYWQFF